VGSFYLWAVCIIFWKKNECVLGGRASQLNERGYEKLAFFDHYIALFQKW